MQDILDFIFARWWVTRDNCGWWTFTTVAIYAISNFWIWISYERIPRELAKLAAKGVTIFDEKNSNGFCKFIKACGRGHLLENVLVFIWPHYLFFMLWHLRTAVLSQKTASSVKSISNQVLSAQESSTIDEIRSTIHLADVDGGEIIQRLRKLDVQLEKLQTERLSNVSPK